MGMLPPVGVAGVIGLGGGGVCPTGGRAAEGLNSLALGFNTNSLAFGLSLDLTAIGFAGGAGATLDGMVGATPIPDTGVVVGGVLTGVGVLCSMLSCRAIIEAVGGDVLLTSVAVVVGGDVPGPCLLRSPC